MESDLTLLAAAKKMDGDALIKIFDLYSAALYRYTFHLCHNAVLADQIVGDIFARLLELLSAGGGPDTNLRSYLYEMAYHLVVDDARHSHRIAPIEVVEFTFTDQHFSLVSSDERSLYETVLGVIIKDLTDDQRHVIMLRFLEGFSVRETAAILGKKVSNVMAIQYRAITALRKALIKV